MTIDGKITVRFLARFAIFACAFLVVADAFGQGIAAQRRRPAQTTQPSRSARPAPPAQTAQPQPPRSNPRGTSERHAKLDSVPKLAPLPPANDATLRPVVARLPKTESDPLRKNPDGVQTRYPAIAKIIGRGSREEERGKIPLYYGSGAYVAEYGPWGIVLTNWHVVCESDESIEVVFPSGSTPARAILKDQKWDLAALIVRKPTNVTPIPISLDVPSVGEKLWTAGYGPTGGLDDFQIHEGTAATYVSLDVTKEDLEKNGLEEDAATFPARNGSFKPLYETVSIDVGVRRGDSGGPILNEYGELAGVLWGSDGKSTMGTTGVRLQVFLTQAILQASRIRANRILDAERTGASPDEIPARGERVPCPDALYSDLPMADAVQRLGCFAVSTAPIYQAGNGVDTPRVLRELEKTAALKHARSVLAEFWKSNDDRLPPSPPIFSPTFVVQQRQVKQDRPELISDSYFDKLDGEILAAVRRERAVIDSDVLATRTAATGASYLVRTGLTRPASEENYQPTTDSIAATSADVDAGLGTAAPSVEADVVERDPAARSKPSAPLRLTGVETYGVICAFFCAFCFAVRSVRTDPRGDGEYAPEYALDEPAAPAVALEPAPRAPRSENRKNRACAKER